MRLLARLLAIAMLLGPAAAPADDGLVRHGSAAEAQDMVDRAIALFDSLGPAAAFTRFNEGDPAFFEDDLYIFVIARDGLVVAQAADPSRVGLDALTLTDADGAPYGRWLVEDATPAGAWVDYKREDPLTGRIEQKSSWVRLHDGFVFGCGIYKID